MNSWIAFAYHTPDQLYRHFAEQLETSLRRFRVVYDIEEVPARETWVRNCAQKPEAILRALDRHTDKDIAYLDADAQLWSRPDLFDTVAGDVAVHYLRGEELCSGVLYFRNNDRARALVREWALRQIERPDEWDQKVLQSVIEANPGMATVERLPAEYCTIRGISTTSAETPVIFQHQASCLARKIAAGWTFDQAISTRR